MAELVGVILRGGKCIPAASRECDSSIMRISDQEGETRKGAALAAQVAPKMTAKPAKVSKAAKPAVAEPPKAEKKTAPKSAKVKEAAPAQAVETPPAPAKAAKSSAKAARPAEASPSVKSKIEPSSEQEFLNKVPSKTTKIVVPSDSDIEVSAAPAPAEVHLAAPEVVKTPANDAVAIEAAPEAARVNAKPAAKLAPKSPSPAAEKAAQPEVTIVTSSPAPIAKAADAPVVVAPVAAPAAPVEAVATAPRPPSQMGQRTQMPGRIMPPPRPMAKAEIFVEGDYVVYPTHGVGKVERIATEDIAGHTLELIHITFEENRMTLRVPVSKARTAGLRKLATRKLFDEALAVLKGRARIKRTMWSRRAQEYDAKINSGDPISIAEVVRDLHRNSGQPDQSFSERQIYEAALDRLAAELGALDKIDKMSATIKLIEFLKTV